MCSRKQVEGRLRQLGCEPTGETLETSELWVVRDYYFLVPCEGPDKRCDEYTLNAIIADVEDHIQRQRR